jgi:hypothetical protein
MTTDPFERAAQYEEREEIAREMRRAWAWNGISGSGVATALVAFGLPYVIWGLVRAAGFHFGDPTMPQSLIRFFFGRWWIFGAYTVWMLFLLWAWAIERTSRK